MCKGLDGKIKELRELKRMADELQAEIDSIQDAIKAEMTASAVDTLSGSDWKVTWKEVVSSRIDTKKLKAELPEISAKYTKQTVSKRFTLV